MKAHKPRLERLKAAKVPSHRTRLRLLPGAAEAAAPDLEPALEEAEDALQELDVSIRRDLPPEPE